MIKQPEYNIAVCVKSFNRPEYLQRCISYLEDCINKHWVDWHLFQDGAVNKYSGIRRAKDEEINQSIEVLESADLPNKTIHINEYNLNHAEQTENIFNLYNDYKLLIILDGDVLLSKYSLIQNIDLMEYFNGVTSTLFGMDYGFERLNDVAVRGKSAWFVFSMWRNEYKIIKNRFNDFMDIVRGQDFWPSQRPADAILDEFAPDNPYYDPVPAIDYAVNQILREFEIPRIQPLASRCSNIGKIGMNSTESVYQETRLGDEWPINYEADSDRHNWNIDRLDEPFNKYSMQEIKELYT